ncbi:putative bifunctional diguanylate cyclase/phosphodiesterase [Chitinibacteraceae bacterium HSL-7]
MLNPGMVISILKLPPLRTVRGKLLFVLLLLSAVAAVLMGTMVYSIKQDDLRFRIDQQLSMAVVAAPLLLPPDAVQRLVEGEALPPRDVTRYEGVLTQYREQVGLSALGVFGSDNRRHQLRSGDVTPLTLPDTALPAWSDSAVSRSLWSRQVASDGRTILVGAEIELGRFAAERHLVIQQSILAGLVVMLTGAVGALWLAQRVSRPIERLADGALRLERGDFRHQVVLESDDEFGRLAQTLGKMSGAVVERERELQRMALVDPLTGLANRVCLIDAIERLVAMQPPHFAVLLFDLDQFKYINDYLGYQVGDAAIAALARRLAATFRREGEVCARLSGDEYAVLIPNANADQMPEHTARVEGMFGQPVVVAGQKLELGASIGYTLYPLHGDDGDLLLRHAEIAMYAAKRLHRGPVQYDPVLDLNRQTQLALLSDLRTAVAQNQLVLYYQPKISMRDGSVTSVEALVRWQHPERGWISPGDFIPFAEQTGRLRLITQWVLSTALNAMRSWREIGIHVAVSINIGVSDAEDEAFIELVEHAVARDPDLTSALCLEITETGVMNHPGKLLANLNRIRKLGLALSIDDFGTGYSSFAYLAQMPVNELKIDQTFVSTLDTRFENVSIVRSTIELGHILGLSVVAEGVETESVWQALAVMGCDQVQGFLVSRPLSEADFVRWMQSDVALPYTPPDMTGLDASLPGTPGQDAIS